MILDPILPLSWIITLAVALTILTLVAHLRSNHRLGRKKSLSLTLLRLSGILLVVSLLLRFSKEETIIPPSQEHTLLIALDRSGSMAEDDIDGVTRFDFARDLLREADLLKKEHRSLVRLHAFDSSTQAISPETLNTLTPDGDRTHFHSSLRQLFRNHQGPPPSALILLSDGHDLEAIPPGQSARYARNRDTVIYGLPLGAEGSARDVSIRISSYHPYTFRKQLTRLDASIRTIGCPRETLVVNLLREGKVVNSKTIQTGEQSFHEVGFIASEDEPGQFEYAFEVQPITNEAQTGNNTAVSYLNVLDEKIRLLMIEGQPYWDTTFLRRSLARNDKLDIDALVRFTPERVKAIRSNPKHSSTPLTAPQTVDEFSPYKIVILGKEVDKTLGQQGIEALQEWVDKKDGIVVFSRGQAWEDQPDLDIEPIRWSENTSTARLEIATAALSIPPFQLLHQRTASGSLPEIRSYQPAGDPKTLASSYVDTTADQAGVVYRRFGSGQTLSLGVGDLWKWVFNAKTEFDNNLYDLFWDQLVLWLLSNGGINPGSDYSFQTNTANLALGESITFTLSLNGLAPPQGTATAVVTQQDEEAAILALSPNEEGSAYTATFTPRATGRYSATIKLPNGKTAKARFISFAEEVESTETATDPTYLGQLAAATGGRLIKPEELKDFFANLLRENSPAEARTRLNPLWDQVWVLLLITFLLALEWFLRRRWGLT